MKFVALTLLLLLLMISCAPPPGVPYDHAPPGDFPPAPAAPPAPSPPPPFPSQAAPPPGPPAAPSTAPSKAVPIAEPILRPHVQEGDLVVSQGTRVFSRVNFTMRGDIIVNGSGRLVIRDSRVNFDQAYNNQYYLRASGDAALELERVRINSNQKWLNFMYTGNATVRLSHVEPWDPNVPWHGASDNARFTVRNSTVGLTLSDNVTVDAAGSDLFFELMFEGARGRFVLPKGYRDRLSLHVPNRRGAYAISAAQSSLRHWGTTLSADSDITFADSNLTIGLNAGSAWWDPNDRPNVTVSGLRARTYDDFTLAFDTNRLTLINTTVTDWYPQAWRRATLEIRNSDLADVNWNGNQAHVIVRNSTASIATGRMQVRYEFYDSAIMGDVTAMDDARIDLYNTRVGGRIIEVGHGKVFVHGMKGRTLDP